MKAVAGKGLMAGVGILLSAVFFCLSAAYAFEVPERLDFEIRWSGIKTGDAALDVKNEDGVLRITSTAASASWVSVFFHVEDKIDVRADPSSFKGTQGAPPPSQKGSVPPATKGSVTQAGKGSAPPAAKGAVPPKKIYRISLKEGNFKREREFVFSRLGKVLYIDHLKNERLEFDVPEVIYDPLSAFYVVRKMNLSVGGSVNVLVFDNKSVWDMEVKVLRKEKVKTPLGVFDTIVIKPLMKTEGIFKSKGDIHIWVTDDELKMPVKLQTKIAIGSVTAILVKKTP